MRQERAKLILAALGSVGALAYLFLALTPSPPQPPSDPHAGIGQAMAEETRKLLGAGGRITMVVRDTTVFKSPATDIQVKAFCETLKKAKLTVAATNLIKEDPLRIVRVPAGDFFQILRRQTDKDVIASFMGPPMLRPEDRAKLTDNTPRVVALCSGNMPRHFDLRQLFAENLLHVAVIHRPDPAPVVAKSDKPGAMFKHFFQVITSDNVNEMPVPAQLGLRPPP